jgi:hypothetical protein
MDRLGCWSWLKWVLLITENQETGLNVDESEGTLMEFIPHLLIEE